MINKRLISELDGIRYRAEKIERLINRMGMSNGDGCEDIDAELACQISAMQSDAIGIGTIYHGEGAILEQASC
jgi:hypothetical protein